MRSTLGFSALLVALGAGCGDDLPPPAPRVDAQPIEVDGGPGDGGFLGDAEVPIACADPDGPTIEILAPSEASDPVADEVVVGPFGEVSCRVTRGDGVGAGPVDPESVIIEVLDENGVLLATPAVTAEGDVFTAQPNLGGLPNGPLAFRCSASDTAAEAHCNSAEVATFLDNGPAIAVDTPAPDSVHASLMTLRYRVDEAPLADGDSEAAVAGHTLVVAGATITPTLEGSDWVATIDFEDRAVYPEPLSGAYKVTITATNERSPVPAERTHEQDFSVDTQGPEIVITTPESGDLVGGAVVVEATITDLISGVDADSVVLRAGGMDFPMTNVADTDTYRASFDAAVFAQTIVEVTLNLTARDLVGNSSTEFLPVKLDSVGPILSLDPPDVREAIRQSGVVRCSELFDPLGDDSVDDGEVRGSTPELRVRAFDRTNGGLGGDGTVTFFSGIARVDLLVLDDTSRALLVDQDGDGICDAINPAVEPDPTDPESAVLIGMEPLSDRGRAYYPAGIDPTLAGAPASAYAGAFSECTAGSDTTAPSALCAASSPLTRIINRPFAGVPAIYGKPPVTADICAGDAWDFAGAGVSEGWVCVVARGVDELGNEGVSPPLRMCLTDGVGTDPCGGGVGTIRPESERPTCTDGCTLPESFADFPELQQIGPLP